MSGRIGFFLGGQERFAEPYHYVASGLDNIYLMNGFSREQTAYGPVITIENLNGLHRAIGLHIMEKSEPLTGPEFRFLRKQMGLTQKQLSDVMNVTDQTIANYEKGKIRELGSADPFIRLQYLVHVVPDETRAKLLKAITDAMPKNTRRKMPDVPRLKLVEHWQEFPQAA